MTDLQRPDDPPMRRWLLHDPTDDSSTAMTATLTDGRIWATGFDVTLVLRSKVGPLDVQDLTSFYYRQWDEPPVGAYRITVRYTNDHGGVTNEDTPRIATSGVSAGGDWLRATFWISPLPQPTDRVIITLQLDSAEISWVTEWSGMDFLSVTNDEPSI